MLRIILWAKLHLRFKMFLNFVRPLLYEWLHLRVIKIWIALFHINFILLFILVLMKMFRFFITNFNPIYRRFMHLYKTFFLIIGKLYCNYKPSFDLSLGLSAQHTHYLNGFLHIKPMSYTYGPHGTLTLQKQRCHEWC